jgi:cytosine/adenosine deaminase-related metal-dependent hydrolase
MALGALPPGSILAHGVHLGREQVRMAAQAGCWLVQNARSNAGNRVGYPSALVESPRVALGTDGYPSDMPAEFLALSGTADANDDHGPHLVDRLDAGRWLIAERFAVPVEGLEVPAAASLDVQEIRREASQAAQRLWARMR